jgi:hypothetical protein
VKFSLYKARAPIRSTSDGGSCFVTGVFALLRQARIERVEQLKNVATVFSQITLANTRLRTDIYQHKTGFRL